ncbi:MAG TPA: hypothetical protein VJ302_11250 [Blastocatellia bacterium]|nr:hypothetical protein [Blastocatellia bacterium]
MMIATFIIVRRIPLLYESRATVLITAQQLPEELTQAPTFALVMQQLNSRANLGTLVHKHKLYPQSKELDPAILSLQGSIKTVVTNRGYYPDGPESVALTFRYSDPAVAQKVMTDLVGTFEGANQTIRQMATTEVRRVNEKIGEVEGRLRQIAPKQDLAQLRNQTETRLAAEQAMDRARLDTTKSAIETLSDREYMLQKQIADLRQQSEEQEKVAKSRNTSLAANPALGALLVRRADLEAQVKEFLKVYTEKNPRVVSTREQLAQVNREISRLEAQGSNEAAISQTPEMLDLRRIRQQLRQAEAELEIVQRDRGRKEKSLTGIPSTPRDLGVPETTGPTTTSDMRTEYDRLIVRYNAFLDKQDALMKLTGVAGSGTPLFQVLDVPTKPLYPVAPNRPMLMLIGLGISLIFGLLVVFALELPRMFLLNDEQDIEYYLGAPVIALIPETTTPVERSRSRRLRWTRGMIILILAAGMIPALIVVLNRVGIFQILGYR